MKKITGKGLPEQLKSGIERLSGMNMENVKVYYNSDQPSRLNAHAYAQGSDIKIAPGEEKYLPHEAWHVEQQKQGRVQPTSQLEQEININNSSDLEKKADEFGSKAMKKG